MSARHRHVGRLRSRMEDKLSQLDDQEEFLHDLVSEYVSGARSRARSLLSQQDTGQFLNQYMDVMQQLDRCFNTCEVLAASAEDLIVLAASSEVLIDRCFNTCEVLAASAEYLIENGHVEDLILSDTLLKDLKGGEQDNQPKTPIQLGVAGHAEGRRELGREWKAGETFPHDRTSTPEERLERDPSPIKDLCSAAHVLTGLQERRHSFQEEPSFGQEDHSFLRGQEEQMKRKNSVDEEMLPEIKSGNNSYAADAKTSGKSALVATYRQTNTDKEGQSLSSHRESTLERLKGGRSYEEKSPAEVFGRMRSDELKKEKKNNSEADQEEERLIRKVVTEKKEKKSDRVPENRSSPTKSRKKREKSREKKDRDSSQDGGKLHWKRSGKDMARIDQDIVIKGGKELKKEKKVKDKKAAEKAEVSNEGLRTVERHAIVGEVEVQTGISQIEEEVGKTKRIEDDQVQVVNEENKGGNKEEREETQVDTLAVTCTAVEMEKKVEEVEAGSFLDDGVDRGPPISFASLPAGKTTPVIVSEAIVSPWYFYVQQYCNQLDLLMENLCLYMSKEGLKSGRVPEPVVGMRCLAQYSADKAYYRAVITEIPKSNDGVHVFFFDYGNSESVSSGQLRQLPKKFAELPAQAICCALAEVVPNNKYGLWTEDATNLFRQLVLGKPVNCQPVCRSSDPTMPHLVKLILDIPVASSFPSAPQMFVTSQINIAIQLVNCKHARAVSISEQYSKLVNSDDVKDNSPKKRILFKMERTLDQSVREESSDDKDAMNSAFEENILKGGHSSNSKAKGSNHEVVKEERNDMEKKENVEKKNISLSEQCPAPLEDRRDKKVMKPRKPKCLPSDIPPVGLVGDPDVIVEDWGDSSVSEVDNVKKKVEDIGTKVDKVESSASSVSDVKVSVDKQEFSVHKQGSPASSMSDAIVSVEKDSAMEDTYKSTSETKLTSTVESSTTSLDGDMSCDSLHLEGLSSDMNTKVQGLEVMLAHIKSPSHFYVHIVSKQTGTTLDKLMRNLNHYFEKQSRKKLTKLSKTVKPEVGKLYCAQFSQDNCYYRAKVTEIENAVSDKPEEVETGIGKVHVFYVDFGDSEWLPKRKLFPLPEEYRQVPPLALYCSLAFVKPVSSLEDNKNGNNTTWSHESVDVFVELTGFEKKLHMHIVHGSLSGDNKGQILTSADSGALGVLLVDNSGTEDICINFDMIRLNKADLDVTHQPSEQKTDAVSQDMKNGNWNPMAEDFFSLRNSYKVDVDDAGVATVGYSHASRREKSILFTQALASLAPSLSREAQDERRICRFFNSGNCWRGERCPHRHVEIVSGVTQDKEEVYAPYSDQSELLPEPGSWVAVEISTILSPSHFYVLLPLGRNSLDNHLKEKQKEGVFGSIEDNPETLDDVMQSMNQNYGKKVLPEGDLIHRAPGEIVAAKFAQDGRWYRARVIQAGEDTVKVFYVDFGNSEWVHERNIYDIEPQFLHLPFQAVECFLCDIEIPSDKERWSIEAKQYFRELVDGQTLVAHVRSRSWNGSLWVELYDTSTDDDVNIAEAMVKSGHAQAPSLTSETSSGIQSRRSSAGSIVFVPG